MASARVRWSSTSAAISEISRFLRAGMRALVNFKQPLTVDPGVDLRGRQRSVAEQFLDRTQIAAARQQVGGEGMPQRVRGCAIGQAKRAAQSRHVELNDPGP